MKDQSSTGPRFFTRPKAPLTDGISPPLRKTLSTRSSGRRGRGRFNRKFEPLRSSEPLDRFMAKRFRRRINHCPQIAKNPLRSITERRGFFLSSFHSLRKSEERTFHFRRYAPLGLCIAAYPDLEANAHPTSLQSHPCLQWRSSQSSAPPPQRLSG